MLAARADPICARHPAALSRKFARLALRRMQK
jgi:hypothetical protein